MASGTETVAEAVGEATGDVVEAAIANAEQRAEQAQTVAEMVTEAAIENERVRRIETIQEEMTTWRGQLLGLVEGLSQRLGEVEAQLSSLRETQLSSETVALLLAMTQPPSTPSPPPTPEPEPAPVPETEEPASAGDAPVDEKPAPRAKRHRFL